MPYIGVFRYSIHCVPIVYFDYNYESLFEKIKRHAVEINGGVFDGVEAAKNCEELSEAYSRKNAISIDATLISIHVMDS